MVFVLSIVFVEIDDLVPVFVIAMVMVKPGEEEGDLVRAVDLVDVLVEVIVFVERPETVGI